MEGEIFYTFQPDAGGIIWLRNGLYLTILAENGDVLWAGIIQLRRRGWFEQHHLSNKIWSNTTQKDISYNQWITWFWQKPPLRATLILPEIAGYENASH